MEQAMRAFLRPTLIGFLVILSGVAPAQDEGQLSVPPRGQTRGEIARSWTGEGEALVRPKADGLLSFSVGAAFEMSPQTCPVGTFLVRLVRGSAFVTIPEIPGSPRSRPAYNLGRTEGDRPARVVGTADCRFLLRAHRKLRRDGEWAESPPATHPLDKGLPAPPEFQRGHSPPSPLVQPASGVEEVPAGTTLLMGPQGAAEFDTNRTIFGLGPGPMRSERAGCPQASGLMSLVPQGVFFTLPEFDQSILYGVRRDPQARVTTVIFEAPECRVEVEVSKEVRDGDQWARLPLAPAPAARGPTPDPR